MGHCFDLDKALNSDKSYPRNCGEIRSLQCRWLTEHDSV